MNAFTTFVRIYVGLLLVISFGGSTFLAAGFGWQQPTVIASILAVLAVGAYLAFIAALPLLVVVALGWVVCGGLKS